MKWILHIDHGKAFHPHIPDIAVSCNGGFNPEAAVGSVVAQIFQCNLIDAARYFAANGNSKACPNLTVLHRDIMAGAVYTDTVCISSRFDADAVVIAVSDTVFHQNVVAGIDVDPIGAGTFSPTLCNLYAIHMDMVTVTDMDIPETGSH